MEGNRNAQLPSWAMINEDGIGVIELNGTHIEVDMTDPDFYEKFMDIAKRFRDYKAPEGASSAEAMSDQVDMIDDAFDDLLGDGMADKLFKTRSLMQRLNFFTVFAKFGEIQRQVMQDYASITTPSRGFGNDVANAKPQVPRNRKERREADRRARRNSAGIS